MSTITHLKIEPIRLGGMPIAWKFAEQLRISEAFAKHVPSDPRDKISVSGTLLIALVNVILERFPLYKVGEWARERRLIDESLAECLNDDRVGRALDRLFRADRAALLTEIVLRAIGKCSAEPVVKADWKSHPCPWRNGGINHVRMGYLWESEPGSSGSAA